MEVGIVGAPIDLGADRRGVDMGPSAIRYADLDANLRHNRHGVRDFGDITAPVHEIADVGSQHLKHLDAICSMANCLAERVSQIMAAELFPLVLGGDHSVSLGSVTAVGRDHRIGVLWMDAHGDFNVPETSPSGNIHGMVLAALAGFGDEQLVDLGGYHPKVQPDNIALVGIRELDSGERDLLRASGAHVFTMHEVDREGIARVMEQAIERITEGVDGLHVSLDLDVLDPTNAPGVGTPVRGGLSYRETHLAMELIAESRRMTSMDVVEVNPVLDTHNETAILAREFILSALGKRIL